MGSRAVPLPMCRPVPLDRVSTLLSMRMRLCGLKRNYLLTIPALAILGCTLAFAQSAEPVTDTPTCLLLGHTRLVNTLAFSPDGKTIVSGSTDKSVRLWESETGKSVGVWQGHNDQVSSVSFSPNGRFVASASRDKTIRFGIHLNLRAPAKPGNRFSGTPGRHLFAGRAFHSDRKSKWRGEHVGSCHAQTCLHVPGARAGIFSGLFERWKTACGKTRVKLELISDASSGQLVRSFEGHDLNILWIAFSPDNRSLATASADETVKLWDISAGKLIQTFRRHQGSVIFVGFLPDGNRTRFSR